MLALLAKVLYYVSIIFTAESLARESRLGRQFFTSLSTGTTSFIRWRAEADNRAEVQALRRNLVWAALVVIVLGSIARAVSSLEAQHFFIQVASALAIAWVSLEWTFDPLTQLRELRRPIIIALGLPWLLMLFGLLVPQLLVQLSDLLISQGVIENAQYHPVAIGAAVSAGLFVLVLLTVLTMLLFALLVFNGISVFILLIIYGSTSISRLSQRYLGDDYIRATALVIFLIGSAYQLFFQP